MRLFRLALLALGSGAVCAAAGKPENPEVLVVSDVLVEPAAILRPTKEKPIYYVILGGAERPLGDAIAGEPMPDRTALTQEIERALGTQGFTLTRLGGPKPSLAILFSYGSANLSTLDLDDTDPTTGETTTSTISFNQREIAQLVGAFKADRHLLMSSEADRINEAARDNRLYIFIAALDVEALAKKQKKLLWRTRISIESRRHNLPDSMHVMLTSAAPYFATETDLPQFLDDTDRRKARVEVGTPVVVPDESAKAPNPPGARK